MPEIEVKDIEGKVTGSISLPDEKFGLRGKDPLLHEAVVNFLANQRQGTHATKTRGLVRGGGRKPYRQKHTGRSRAGSIRSPLWRGGGVVFGPQPRDYSYSIPKQARRLAVYAALSRKMSDEEVVVVDKLELEEPRTKKMAEIIDNLGMTGKSLLIVDNEKNSTVVLSSRNIPGVGYRTARDLHAYDILSHGRLLLTKAAIEALKGK